MRWSLAVCWVGLEVGDGWEGDEHVVLGALELLFFLYASACLVVRRILERSHPVQGHFGLAVVAMVSRMMHAPSSSAES